MAICLKCTNISGVLCTDPTPSYCNSLYESYLLPTKMVMFDKNLYNVLYILMFSIPTLVRVTPPVTFEGVVLQ